MLTLPHPIPTDSPTGALDLVPGELTAVLGPPGAGKTTLVRALADDVAADVTIADGDDVTLRRVCHAGSVFQFCTLLGALDVVANVTLPARTAGADPDPAWVADVLDLAGLGAVRAVRAGALSASQRARLLVARALVSRPGLLVVDEPAGPGAVELLRAAADRYAQTTVIATAEPALASLADRVVHVEDGQIAHDFEPLSELHVLSALYESRRR